MSFTKLDRTITTSSVMAEPAETFKVFIIFLAHTDPDGIARITAPFISAVGRLTLDSVHEAIKRL
ncbi:MAG: hypothetical protein GX465_18200, partial [Acidobacteria bacterium]|nr:hypothetical protein [Acidobacteriota bacterium]